jgi:phosphate-selective porin
MSSPIKKTFMKFRQSDEVTIILKNDNTMEYIEIIIGPIIDRVNLMKINYQITVENDTEIKNISKNNFETVYKIETDTKIVSEIKYKTKYREFKNHFKIIYVNEKDKVLMSNQDMIDDLDFIKNELITCQINMNLLKQKGETEKLHFYENLINYEQHRMFQIPSADMYNEYLDKIAKILDKEIGDDSTKNMEKKIMNNILSLSNDVW